MEEGVHVLLKQYSKRASGLDAGGVRKVFFGAWRRWGDLDEG
jgi:hypothetical protein